MKTLNIHQGSTVNDIFWFFIASLIALAIGATETFQCHWSDDYNPKYTCDLISDEKDKKEDVELQEYSNNDKLGEDNLQEIEDFFNSK